jgi:Bacterial dnaA protein helix-turn-helix
MKVAPACVPDYSNADEMMARYRSIHSAFWRQLMPSPPQPQPPAVEALHPPEPEPLPVVVLPDKFAAMLSQPFSRFEQIVQAVCNEFRMTRSEVFSHRRFAKVVAPRMLIFALARHLTRKSMPELGRRAGGFDHTTVLHAIQKLGPVLELTKNGMPDDATPAEWVRVMREYMGI